MSTRNNILEGAAQTAWVSAWASAAEERHSEGKSRLFGMGVKLKEIAPVSPPEFYLWATELASQARALLGVPIEDVYEAIPNGEKYDKESPTRFGECLAYECLGNGIAWADDNEPHGLQVPRGEVYVYLGPRSGKPVNWHLSVGGVWWDGGRKSR